MGELRHDQGPGKNNDIIKKYIQNKLLESTKQLH